MKIMDIVKSVYFGSVFGFLGYCLLWFISELLAAKEHFAGVSLSYAEMISINFLFIMQDFLIIFTLLVLIYFIKGFRR